MKDEGLVIGHRFPPTDRDYVAPKTYIRDDAGQIVFEKKEKKLTRNTNPVYGRQAILGVLERDRELRVEEILAKLGITEQIGQDKFRTICSNTGKTLSSLARIGRIMRVKQPDVDTHGPMRTAYRLMKEGTDLKLFMERLNSKSRNVAINRLGAKLELLKYLSGFIRSHGGPEYAVELDEIAEYLTEFGYEKD